MGRKRSILLALVIGLLPAIGTLLPQSALAADVVVGQGSYACDRDGLAAAIAAADDGSMVTFDCTESLIGITSVITITGSVTIAGSNGGNAIILDGGYDENVPGSGSQIFDVEETGNLTLEHLTLQHGKSIDGGGAIQNYGTLTISQSSFSDNAAGLSTLDFGGGGAIDNRGTLTISQGSFSNNHADREGGAIYNFVGTLEISQSSFSKNSAGGNGGAIANYGMLTVDSSTFSGNTASRGSTFAIRGGTIRWSTIVQPEGATPALGTDASVTLAGVILAGPGDNCELIGASTTTDDSYTLSDDASCQLDGDGAQPNTDPMFPDTPSTTMVNGVEQTYYPLSAESPAVDTGGAGCDTAGQPDVDQLGNTRPHGSNYLCDIGAIEDWPTNESVGGMLTVNDGNPVYAGQEVEIEISGSDVDDPDLSYYLDCSLEPDEIPNSEDGQYDVFNALDWGLDTTKQCSYPEVGEVIVFGAATDNAGNIGPNQGTVVSFVYFVDILPLDPADLCANRWSGDLRIPASSRCANTETLLHIAPESPVTLCANRWTGEARYSQYGRCRSTETSYEANGTDSVPVCVNRWSGDLRIDSHCYSTERSDQL